MESEEYEVVVVERVGGIGGEGLLQLPAEVGLRRLRGGKSRSVRGE
jgi:hypothetical protein